MVPRIWNQTNPLFDQWAPCWWLSASTQLWPVSDLLSLSFLHFLSPPQKLKELSRGYLEVVKTLFDRHSPRLKVNWLRSLHGPEHEHRTEGKRNGGKLPWYPFISVLEVICIWLATPAGRPCCDYMEEIWLKNNGCSVLETTSSP